MRKSAGKWYAVMAIGWYREKSAGRKPVSGGLSALIPNRPAVEAETARLWAGVYGARDYYRRVSFRDAQRL